MSTLKNPHQISGKTGHHLIRNFEQLLIKNNWSLKTASESSRSKWKKEFVSKVYSNRWTDTIQTEPVQQQQQQQQQLRLIMPTAVIERNNNNNNNNAFRNSNVNDSDSSDENEMMMMPRHRVIVDQMMRRDLEFNDELAGQQRNRALDLMGDGRYYNLL